MQPATEADIVHILQHSAARWPWWGSRQAHRDSYEVAGSTAQRQGWRIVPVNPWRWLLPAIAHPGRAGTPLTEASAAERLTWWDAFATATTSRPSSTNHCHRCRRSGCSWHCERHRRCQGPRGRSARFRAGPLPAGGAPQRST